MPPPKVQPKSLLDANPFAVLADPHVDEMLAQQQDKAAQRHAARGYTVPKLTLFGADIPASTDPRPIFEKALGHGYRAFDTASAYDSIGSLAEVGAQARALDDLYVIYKIKPADDQALKQQAQRLGGAQGRQLMQGSVSSQLAQATQALKRQPEILMLHELGSDTANDKTLKQLAQHVKAGQAKGLGLSNVNLEDLKKLNRRAKELGCPIKCVENRFSPYHRDDSVRAYCEANNIRFIAYGLMGSAQKGACVDEGHGSPTQFLLPRLDPRLAGLAEAHDLSTGELLIAWAYRHNVDPVAFSTDDQRIQDNHEARHNPAITDEILDQVDALFVGVPKAQVRAMASSDRAPGLKALYGAFEDPSMWFILDTLTEHPAIAALLAETATDVADAAPFGQGDAALKNFALNLMRHVGDLQSAGFASWPEVMTPQLGEVAEAMDRPEVRARFSTWANKNAEVGGDFVNATAAFPNMLAPAEAQGPRDLDLSEGWQVFTSSAFEDVVPAPEAGQSYYFYRLQHDEYEGFTAQVEDVQGQSLRVIPEAD